MKNRSFEKDSFLLLMLSMTGNALNYVFQVLSGRSLSVVDYGSLTVLFSIMSLAAVPASTMSLIMSHHVTHVLLEKRQAYYTILKKVVGGIVILAALTLTAGVVFSRQIAGLFKIDSSSMVVFAFAIISLSFILSIAVGAFQGSKRFMALGLFNLALPIVKMLSLIPAVLSDAPKRISMILFTLTAGSAVLALASVFLIRNLGKKRQSDMQDDHDAGVSAQSITGTRRFIVMAAVTSLGMAFLSNMDLLFIKHYFDGSDSGLYSSALIFGKVVLYIPNALISVMFPMITESSIRKEKSFLILVKTMAYTSGIVLAALGFVTLFKDTLITVLYGARYADATQYVFWSMCNFIPICLLIVLTNYCLAKLDMNFILPTLIAGMLVNIIWTIADHADIKSILMRLFLVNTIIMVTNMARIFHNEYTNKSIGEGC